MEKVAGPNELTQKEADEGWVLMFDGESSNGWRGYMKQEFPKGWEVADGTLHCVGSGMGEAGAEEGGDILYDRKFSNFHLKLEWKISEGGNTISATNLPNKNAPFSFLLQNKSDQ